jgi:hypothetical protein
MTDEIDDKIELHPVLRPQGIGITYITASFLTAWFMATDVGMALAGSEPTLTFWPRFAMLLVAGPLLILASVGLCKGILWLIRRRVRAP